MSKLLPGARYLIPCPPLHLTHLPVDPPVVRGATPSSTLSYLKTSNWTLRTLP